MSDVGHAMSDMIFDSSFIATENTESFSVFLCFQWQFFFMQTVYHL